MNENLRKAVDNAEWGQAFILQAGVFFDDIGNIAAGKEALDNAATAFIRAAARCMAAKEGRQPKYWELSDRGGAHP